MSRGRPDRAIGRRQGHPRQRRLHRESLGGERVEGIHAVRELLVAGRRNVEELVVVSGDVSSPALDEIVELARSKAVPVRTVKPAAFDAFALSAAPQGVAALAEPIVAADLGELAGGAERPGSLNANRIPFLVVLSEVTDPHNLGAILRSALAAGATGVVIGKRRSAPLTATALKAAAGAAEHLPIVAVASIAQAVGELAQRGVWTVGLDPDGDVRISDLEIADRPLALVAGAEGRGLTPLVRRRCDLLCRIPLYGPVESLNVSVAVALAAFTIAASRKEPERSRKT
ncbi:MAG: 23S rRNA (guanosine(2251)-2'-O)-methyltransferase RlmB [Acidimicrobiales bacterium]